MRTLTETGNALLDIVWSSANAPDSGTSFLWQGNIYTHPTFWESKDRPAIEPALNLSGGPTLANTAEHAALAALMVIRESAKQADSGIDPVEHLESVRAILDETIEHLSMAREKISEAHQGLSYPASRAGAVKTARQLFGAVADAYILAKLSGE